MILCASLHKSLPSPLHMTSFRAQRERQERYAQLAQEGPRKAEARLRHEKYLVRCSFFFEAFSSSISFFSFSFSFFSDKGCYPPTSNYPLIFFSFQIFLIVLSCGTACNRTTLKASWSSDRGPAAKQRNTSSCAASTSIWPLSIDGERNFLFIFVSCRIH
mgnify:CR=1 FL=1